MPTRLGGRSLRSVLLVVFVLCVISAGTAAAIEVGDPAPDFRLSDIDGLEHTLAGYSSHPVLLMFFACDADVSIALAPLVQSDIYEPYDARGLRTLGIESQGSTLEQMIRFRDETGVRFPLLMDGQSVQSDYDLPVSSFVLIDADGVARYIGRGPGTEAYDRTALTSAIEESLRETNETKEATWGLIKSLYSD